MSVIIWSIIDYLISDQPTITCREEGALLREEGDGTPWEVGYTPGRGILSHTIHVIWIV